MVSLPYTILLVDDEPDMLRSLRRIFEKEGYTIETAASAHELLNRSNWDQFLAIILDRRLPDGNADDLLPKLKKFAPAASIIIVTGYAELDSTITAFKYGVEDYLLKPVNPNVLKTRLRQITEKKRLETELYLSNRALEAAANGVVITNASAPDFSIIFVNEAFERITGYTKEEVIGKNCRFLQRDDRNQADIVKIRHALKECHEFKGVLRNYRKDGSCFWNELFVSPVRTINDKVTHFIGIQNEITDRKKAEDALRQSEERLHAVVDTAADAIITINKRGVVGSFSKAAERMFGYTTAEAIGKNVSILMSSPYREEHDGYIARYLKTHEARILGTNREVVAQRKDGSTFPIDLAVSEVIGQELFTGIIRDLTDRKKAEEELEKAREELLGQTLFTQRLSALATMAGGISHELNQPLSSIGVYAATVDNLIKSKDTINTELIASSLKNISKQVARAAKIINHMRDFASEKKSNSSTAVEPHHVVESVLELLGQQLRNHNIKIVNEIEPNIKVQADQTRLEQVFVILISNARDSIDHCTYPSGEIGEICMSSHCENASILLRIEDNGSGVHENVKNCLFEPFMTTKGPGRGMGLGLSICHGILKDYNATITLEKTDQNGSIFLLRFPSLKIKK